MHRPAAVDVDRLAGDEGGIVGGEESDGAGDVSGKTASLERLQVIQAEGEVLLVGKHLQLGLGLDRTRSDGVYGYSVASDSRASVRAKPTIPALDAT
jgi:hypothetical protein